MRTIFSELKAILDTSLEVCNKLDKGIVSVSPSFAGLVVRFKDNCSLILEDESVIVLPLVFVFSNKFLSIINDKNLYVPSSLINTIVASEHKTVFDNLHEMQCRNIRFTNQLQFDNYRGTYTMLNTPAYKLREKFRFWDGIYDELPSHLAYLLDEYQMDKVREVFAHRSIKDKSKVAFTKTPELGDKDVQTVMRPGRFLKLLFPDISNEICKRFAASMTVAEDYKIDTSDNEHDFADIYMNYEIESCMSDGEEKFTSCYVGGKFFHPSRVYALENNGVEICWITDSVTGEIVGRCLLVDKNEYTKIYPTDDQHRQNICHKVLEDNGYSYNSYALSGKKLRKVVADNGGIICPYIDPHNVGVAIFESHLEVGGLERADHERGMLEGHLGDNCFCSCDECGEDIAEEYEVFYTTNGLSVCSHCIEAEYTLAFDAALGVRGHYKTCNFVFYQIHGMIRDIPIVNPYGGFSPYKVLSNVYYDEPLVAFHGDVVTDEDGETVVYDDIEEFNIFIHPATGLWCSRDDYAVVDGEVVEYPVYTADLSIDFRSQPYGLPGFLTDK